MSVIFKGRIIAGELVVDAVPTAGSTNPVSSDGVKSALTQVETDLASIHATGSTNTTGATITKNTYFYLNNVLVQAKADIASGATYTSGTNYETVTAGGLNDLMSAFKSTSITVTTDGNGNCDSGLSNKLPITSIKCTSAIDIICNIFSQESYNPSMFPNWTFHFTSAVNNTNIANQTLTVLVFYIDM